MSKVRSTNTGRPPFRGTSFVWPKTPEIGQTGGGVVEVVEKKCGPPQWQDHLPRAGSPLITNALAALPLAPVENRYTARVHRDKSAPANRVPRSVCRAAESAGRHRTHPQAMEG